MRNVAYIRSTNIYDDSRATKEIFALAEAGYSVKVLGWDRDGKAKEKTEQVFSTIREQVQLFFYSGQLQSGSKVKKMAVFGGWFCWVNRTIKLINALDIVHLCNLDAALGIVGFCKRKHIPMVYDVYDYYIDSHDLPTISLGVIENLEIRCINQAKVTIICTEERREQIAKAKPQKVIVLHNSPDVPEYEVAEELKYDYVYCGSMGEKRLIKETIDQYSRHDEIKVYMAGYDTYSKYASECSKQYENFVFAGAIPYTEVLEREKESKVISAIYEPSIRNHRLCAPNKFYEALALGKPVIVCKGTGIDRIVEENQIGAVINYDAAEFYDALTKLISDLDACKSMGEKARKLYEEKYMWSKMKGILIEAYELI